MAPTYKLTYFNIMAMAEPIRMLFSHAGVEFEDNRIMDPDNDWPELKKRQPFGVVPVLEITEEDGSVKLLSQTAAIYAYLGKRFNLAGENEFDAARCIEIYGAIQDLITATGPLWTPDKGNVAALTAEQKEALKNKLSEENFPNLLRNMTRVLEANSSGFLVGKSMTWADIAAAQQIVLIQTMYKPDIIKGFPKVEEHMLKILASPKIKEWIDKRPKTPF